MALKGVFILACLLLIYHSEWTIGQEFSFGNGLNSPRAGPNDRPQHGPGGRPPRPPGGLGESHPFDFWTLFSGGEEVECDYDTQAGSRCVSCDQVLTCSRRGGHVRTCRGLLRHCRDGRCDFRQSDACAAANTTIATTTVATNNESTTQANNETATESE